MPTKDQIEQVKKINDPIVRQKYAKLIQLPQNLQEAMFDTKTADIIEKTAKENNLSSEQLWEFSYLVGMIFLGELHIAEFIKAIQEKCKLPHEASRSLARQINRELFLSLKEDLKTVHKIPKWPREDEGAEPVSQPVPPKEAPQQTPPKEIPQQPPVQAPVQNQPQQEENRTINLRK